MASSSSVQRSFRLSQRTAQLLDDAAGASDESRNALTDRLLGEALRTENHPLVRFRTGGDGRREPYLVGTRHRVRQLLTSVRAHDGDVEETARYLGLEPAIVRAAIDYVADFSDEIEHDIERTDELERRERARWERSRAALA